MSEMDEMIKMLADAPEEQRKSMLFQRLKMLAGQPDEQLVNSLAGLITAVHKLKPKKIKPFIATRTKVIMGMEKDEIEKLLTARLKAAKVVDEQVHKTDLMTTMEVAKEMGEEKFNKFSGMMKMIADKHGFTLPKFD